MLRRTDGFDHGLERRRGELVLRRVAVYPADRVAHPDVGQPPELADLRRPHGVPANPATVLEYSDPGDLVAAFFQALPHAYRAGEHAHIGDLLPRRASFDLEDAAAGRPFLLAGRGRELADQAFHQRLDARTGQRRA